MSTASLTRRSLCAATLIGMLPTMRARAVEPITCLEAAAAVVGIISGISGMQSDAELRRQMRAINAKLDVVIANQEQILAEIKALRFYIDAAFEISWRNAYSRRIQAYSDELNDLASETRINDRVRAEYENLRVEANRTANEIGQMDIAGFPSFSVGVAVTLYCMVIERIPPRRFESTAATFAEKLTKWLDPANPRSVVTLIAATEAEIKKRRAELDARSRTAVVSQRRVSAGSDCTELETLKVTANGDFAAGYTAATTTERSDRSCKPQWDPCSIPRRCIVWDEPVTAGVKIVNTTIPVFTPSGYELVDSFNKERIAIFELLYDLEQQQGIAQKMTEMRAALQRP